MTQTRVASAIALTATAYLAGCHHIKVNGKPLGGGGSSPSSSSSSAAASESERSGVPAEWCADAGYRPAQSEATAAEFANVKMDDSSSPEHTAGQLAYVLCAKNKVADFDKIMTIRATWMAANDIDERDFIVLAALNKGRTYDSQDWTKMQGPASQVPGMHEHKPSFEELDRLGARASMVLRFSVVGTCLERGAEHNPLLRHILCTREPLDTATAYAEIDSTTELNNGTRYQLRKMVRSAAAAAAKARADIAARAKADPAIAKVIAIADAQFKEWQSPSPVRAKLIDQLVAMETATRSNKHSAFAGCGEKTRAAWQEHLNGRKLPKVSSENTLQTFVGATLDSPDGYLAFQALRLCSASTETVHKDLRFVGSDMIRRGPRTATIAAWIAAGEEIKFDDRALSMGFLLANGGLRLTERSYVRRSRQGVIEKLEPFAGGVEITFKEVLEPREDCLQWKETNRIESLRADGSAVYRQECQKWGMVKMDVTAAPIMIGKLMAQGLEPGMYLTGNDGIAIAATSGAKSSKPVWVLGASVK